jgi:hypothetical protein
MGFEKGHPRYGGKQKGAENHTTKRARELFTLALEGQVQHIQSAFDEVREKDPAKYLDLFAKYAKYFVPVKMDITTMDESLKVKAIHIVENDKGSQG